MREFELVIVGGGLTAARAVKAYREAGGSGAVALLAAEPVLPYHRPALSKRYLRGEVDPPYAEDQAFYAAHDVEVMLHTPVTAVDTAARTVSSSAGDLRYRKLLLASGASPRHLHVPGAELAGVHGLRTLADSDRIREAARTAERAVVVGGGFIGMEVAASLRQLGLAVSLIHLGSGLFDQFGSTELSADLASLYRARGVELLLHEEVASFGGEERLAYVETTSGVRVAAGLAVVGVGVVPNVDYLRTSGIALDNGVVVNERFEANAAGVYAAGDVANFYDQLYGRRRRIEHWSNANYQGTAVGRILAGEPGGYDTVSSFFTEVFGTRINVFGDVTGFDEINTDGSLAAGKLLVSYGDAGRLVGVLTVGQSEELEAVVNELIRQRAPLDALAVDLVGATSRTLG
jgi:NADPH-dependent 2,4-dienoyl-CoA reductase/sulfur reductase-like enzyme